MPKPNLVPLGESLPEVKVTHDIVLTNQDDERALINLVPEKVKEAILKVASEFPHYLEANERNLHKMLEPSDTDDKIRLSFWAEYNRAQDSNTSMRMVNVYGKIMSNECFFKLTNNPQRVAWMINPPEDYMISLEASLNHGKENLNKLLKMELFDNSGNLKKNEASIFIKAFELTQNRVKGAVIQKMEQKTASLHVHKKEASDEEIKERLESLRLQQEEAAIEITAKNSD